MPMPMRLAVAGEDSETRLPFQKKAPESGLRTPFIILTRVDFPAPFSPRRASFSPDFTVKETSWFAFTEPNDLEIERASNSAVPESVWTEAAAFALT